MWLVYGSPCGSDASPPTFFGLFKEESGAILLAAYLSKDRYDGLTIITTKVPILTFTEDV